MPNKSLIFVTALGLVCMAFLAVLTTLAMTGLLGRWLVQIFAMKGF